MRARPLVERFLEAYRKDPSTGCWEWIKHRNPRGVGYGRIWGGTAQPVFLYAHRFSYEHFVGAIPDGMQVDHLCFNKGCVNPSHLEPVTPEENTRRAVAHYSRPWCVHGHKYTEENTRWYRGIRHCKQCERERSIRRRSLTQPAPKTVCKNGHEFTESSTRVYYWKGRRYRICRKCSAIRSLNRYYKLKGKK